MNIDKIFSYFIIVLIATFLFSALAVEISSNITDGDYGVANTASTTQNVLSENGTTTTLNLSDSSATVTSSSAVSKNMTWLDYDAATEYVTNKTNWELGVGSNSTIIVWYNRTGNSSAGDNQYLFKSFGGSSPVFGCKSTGELWTYISGEWGVSDTKVCEINNGVWTMYTFVFNGTNYLQYVNGSNLVNISETGGGAAWLGFDIGGTASTPRSANGSIDEVRVYNRTLTNAQLDAIYNSGRIANSSINSTGLMLWMKLDEGFSTNIHSQNQSGEYTTHTGALSGATWANDGNNVTLVENTDYLISSNLFTVSNTNLSWSGIVVSLDESWDTTYGFHLVIIKLVVGFVCLIILASAIVLVLKIFEELNIK